MRLKSMFLTVILSFSFVIATTTMSLAAIVFDGEAIGAIEAEIAALVAAGETPELAAKIALANAVEAILAENPDYPGGLEALQADIFEAISKLQLPGMSFVDMQIVASHALGISTDAAIEAYEQSGRGAQGRENARNRGGNAYGPGGKPDAGSPT